MPFPSIPSDTLRRQHEAANPSRSVWVSANAGSGKTHVLASRVIRLLLEGVPPSKILCLTYTRAAAANMSARVFETLARWTSRSDEDLRGEIASIGAPPPGAAGLVLARKLFARAVETPGGLKIQTIHAFCERLLHLFPFEANVPARFEVADDEKRGELLQRARQHVLAGANAGRGALGAAILRLTDELGQQGFEDLITEAMEHSGILCAGMQKGLTEILRKILEIPEGRDVAAIEREMIEGWLPPDRWLEFAEKLSTSSKNDQNCAKQLRTAYAALQDDKPSGDAGRCLEAYLAVFFTQNGTPRASVVTGSFARAHPAIEDALRCEQERLIRLDAGRKSAAALERTRALIDIASAICRRYQEEKAAQGILDFKDLIDRTLTLLGRSDARWVLYKLDSGIDHILVDEAQDTSEAQWRILEALTEEFTAGAGQAQGSRTFFAVGDEKQSIFSFQGAAHHMFDEMRRSFQKRFLNGARDFQHVQLTHSFRSVPGVLSVIDQVFAYESHKSGVVAPGGAWMPHESLKEHLPGLVEVWPLAKKSADEAPSGWHVPQHLSGSQDPASLVAQRIAQKIAILTSAWPQDYVHEGRTQRPVQARDILILVRRRGPFFEAMIRALKSAGIPAAGADRLEIHHHIAVMDLVAAGRASLLPEDDLTLASVLKSPLLGLDDDDLLLLAPSRKGSLFDALRNAAAEKHAKAYAKLERWRARAGDGAFAFYAALLGADGGRRDMEARLGPEASDAIDEFLRLAIEHEAANPPSLASFLNDVEGVEHSIKRDMESGANTVRVMTVHAAKGLEAKIVFLVDDCTVFVARHEPQIFVLESKVPGERTVAWSPRKELDCAAVAAAREREREASFKEYKRLLYVALSRAEERLYVAGFHRRQEPDKDCWASMIRAALAGEAGAEDVPAFWNPEERILRLASGARGSASAPDWQQGRKEPASRPAVPEWLLRPAPAGVPAAPRLRPSYALSREGSGGQGARGNPEGQRRGRLIHLLLQHLPAIAPAERRHAAGILLSARAAWLGMEEREALCSEALGVLRLPELEELFGPCSMAEVPVAGKIVLGNRQAEVAGRIDRLYEGMSDVLAADFKTGAPRTLDDMPEDYLTQMALYRALLTPLWPGKTLRMLLIWTEGPSVLWLPPGRLDAAIAGLAG